MYIIHKSVSRVNIACHGTWDSVDHVDSDDPYPKAGRRTQTSLHHKVDFHLDIKDGDLPTSGWMYLTFDTNMWPSYSCCRVVYNLERWCQLPIYENSIMHDSKSKISYQVHFVNLFLQLILKPAIRYVISEVKEEGIFCGIQH